MNVQTLLSLALTTQVFTISVNAQTSSPLIIDQVQRSAQEALRRQQPGRTPPQPQATDSDGLPILQNPRYDNAIQSFETACPTQASDSTPKTTAKATETYEMDLKVEPISSDFC